MGIFEPCHAGHFKLSTEREGIGGCGIGRGKFQILNHKFEKDEEVSGQWSVVIGEAHEEVALFSNHNLQFFASALLGDLGGLAVNLLKISSRR